MVTGKQSCKLFSSAGLQSRKSVELRWSLCRGLALSASVPGAVYVGAQGSPGALCVGPRRSSGRGGPLPMLAVSGPDGLCVALRRSLCGGPALFVSGLGALSVGARRSLHVSGPSALCVGARRFWAVSVSGPGGLSLCRVSMSGPGGRPALSMARAVYVGPRRSLSGSLSGPGSPPMLFVSGPDAVSVSGPGALCVGVLLHRGLAVLSQRSLCRSGRCAL